MNLVDDVESELRATGAALVAVHEDECLYCYLGWMLPAHGCDGTLRFALCWARSGRLPVPGFRRWLNGNGGYCDCEVIMNVFDAGREGVSRAGRQRAGVRPVALRGSYRPAWADQGSS